MTKPAHSEVSKIRKWVAWRLVRLARLIYPQSDAVTEFYLQQMMDYAITGQMVTHVDPMKLYADAAVEYYATTKPRNEKE